MAEKSRQMENHLYRLVKKLGLSVTDENSVGRLLGYSIVHSLANFETSSGSKEEIRFEEVKAVMAGLEKAIMLCEKENDHSALFSLQPDVDRYLQSIADSEAYGSKSTLLEILLPNICAAKNYGDRLRRCGLKLYDRIKDEGEKKGNKESILNSNYESIASAFGDRR